MKKLLAILIALVTVFAMCVGCGTPPEEVSREPLNVRYTEAHEGITTEYEYKYDWWKGDFVLLPVTKTVRYEEKWEIQYRITYDNGDQKTEWCSCTEEEYNEAKNKLEESGE